MRQHRHNRLTAALQLSTTAPKMLFKLEDPEHERGFHLLPSISLKVQKVEFKSEDAFRNE